jgi:hypothetical protein
MIRRPWFAGLVSIFTLGLCLSAPAQDAAKSGAVIPPEVVALITDLNDIDRMRVIGPLKLKPDQLDRLIALMEKSTEDHNRKLAEAAVPPIREIAKDIKETRRKVIAGAPIPTDFDEKVKGIQDAYNARRTKQEFDTLKSLSEGVRAVLTSAQIEKATSLARAALDDAGAKTRGTGDKYFNLYVKSVFIDYPNIIPLLKAVRAAVSQPAG